MIPGLAPVWTALRRAAPKPTTKVDVQIVLVQEKFLVKLLWDARKVKCGTFARLIAQNWVARIEGGGQIFPSFWYDTFCKDRTRRCTLEPTST